jgi:hypothetical protein
MTSLIQRNMLCWSEFAGSATKVRYVSKFNRMKTERLPAVVAIFPPAGLAFLFAQVPKNNC